MVREIIDLKDIDFLEVEKLTGYIWTRDKLVPEEQIYEIYNGRS